MKIIYYVGTFVGTFRADIHFDDGMAYHGMNDDFYPLQEYIDKAIFLMGEYDFVQAQIVNYETGEIIATVEINN